MCGRFCCSLAPDDIKAKLHKDQITNDKDIPWENEDKYRASYNVCPTRYIVAMLQGEQEKTLSSMQWGYIPSWSKNTQMNKPINARYETLQEKSMFDVSKNRRCVIVAEGFYEWKKLGGGKKSPYFIRRKDGELMIFAGLYATNNHIGTGQPTCTIITTHSSKFFSDIHNRMPVILEKCDIDKWINNDVIWNDLPIDDLLKPFEGELDVYQVSDAVGSVKNDSPNFIVPVDSKKSSISYFLKQKDPQSKKQAKKEEKEDNPQSPTSSQGSSTSSHSSSSHNIPGKKRRASVVDEYKETKKRATTAAKNPKITNFFGKK